MKKIFLILSLILSSVSFSFAQWMTGTNNALYNINTGFVGIGIQTPFSDLQIRDLSTSKPGGVVAPTTTVLKLSRPGTSGYSYSESAEFRVGHGGPTFWGSQVDLFINGASNINDIPDQQVMTWLYNGNVGIGTTTPNAKLQISATSQTALNLSGNTNSWCGADFLIQRTNPSGSAGYAPCMQLMDATSGFSTMIQSYQGNLQFLTSSASGWIEGMRVTSSGNVLINQTTQANASYKLDVAGSVRANSVVINTTGADFVFEPTYKLMPLSDLKTYIDLNHHLPEIEPAKQMQKEGLNVGDNQTKLLQKIEELTLYLIEKDKEVKKQQQEIDELKKQVSQLIDSENKK